MTKLRAALAQINTTVGDLRGNTAKIIEYIDRARAEGADLVSFPELTITGYPPEDLLYKNNLIRDNRERLDEVIEHSAGIAVVVGFVDRNEELFNAAAVIQDRKLLGVYHKVHLPNYGVFDEQRYFQSGSECPVFDINGTCVGVNVCEDIWYESGPTNVQSKAGARVIMNINGSPYHRGKGRFREQMLADRARDNGVYVFYTNLVGGQDELVFDGGSCVFSPSGDVLARGKQFEEDLLIVDIDPDATQPAVDPAPEPALADLEEVYEALTIGTRDYVYKNGFEKVVIGLSGGIDSTLTATIAADALGPENVVVVTMPSRYSSEGSIADSDMLAKNLGVKLWNISIEDMFQSSLDSLDPLFAGTGSGVAEENLQARMRGNLLMAISNKFGWLVLTTGNKSEMAMGYGTLYGDMAGGFAVIKDVPKVLVYELAETRNARGPSPVIPQSVIDKEPSAELRPDQKDTDSLPPYSVLDPVLEAYVEQDKSPADIIGMGFDEEMVKRVIKAVDRNEYKRRQAAPGVKITPRNFGRDRRMPIVNWYRGF